MAQSRATTQKIRLVEFVSTVLVIAVVINWQYPISYERELARRTISFWVIGYTVSVVALASLVIGISMLWTRRLHDSPIKAATCAAATTLLFLVSYCGAIIGTLPAGLGFAPVDAINAKFLAEWQFLKFAGVISPLCAVLSASLALMETRRAH